MKLAVAMVADDLTGALDASAPFAAKGLRTIVALTHENLPEFDGADVICINTASREIDAASAAIRVEAASKTLAALSPRIFFKKIDSRLKGHVAAETAAALRGSGRTGTVIAPAIPDLGRFVRNGAVVGLGVAEPIDIAAICKIDGASIPETAGQCHLDGVAETLLADNETLSVGARGLALALANLLTPSSEARPTASLAHPILVAIGSRDPITLRQVEHFVANSAPHVTEAPNGVVPSGFRPEAVSLIMVTPGETSEPGDAVAERFALGLSRSIAEHPPASLVISGGETAYAILRSLGVKVLDVLGEALPGVPMARATIGGTSVAIFTKSGGFGTVETISELVGSAVELY